MHQALQRMRESYRDTFDNYLNRWVAVVEQAIASAAGSGQVNQRRPKLELVYTSVVNVEADVKERIDQIGKILFSQQFWF